MSEKIDFVITWVDGNDYEWRKKRNKYAPKEYEDYSESRYRDPGLLKYWFRGVEKYAPWVNKIYFVTEGHVPEWINLNNDKLVHVRHADYIPAEFLPTFSSHPIEWQLDNIPGLSEHFVYFNDDMYIINETNKEMFFYNGLPCDAAIINPILPTGSYIFTHILINNILFINKLFNDRRDVLGKWNKWFNIKYGFNLIRNIIFSMWPKFVGFKTWHLPIPFLKRSFVEVKNINSKFIKDVCSHKFRSKDDINIWVVQYWQYLKGNFNPRIPKGLLVTMNDYEKIKRSFNNKKNNIICINDREDVDFEKSKKILICLFEKKFPNKSSFEK